MKKSVKISDIKKVVHKEKSTVSAVAFELSFLPPFTPLFIGTKAVHTRLNLKSGDHLIQREYRIKNDQSKDVMEGSARFPFAEVRKLDKSKKKSQSMSSVRESGWTCYLS